MDYQSKEAGAGGAKNPYSTYSDFISYYSAHPIHQHCWQNTNKILFNIASFKIGVLIIKGEKYIAHKHNYAVVLCDQNDPILNYRALRSDFLQNKKSKIE